MREVLEETISAGYTVFKFKVGTSIEADRERLSAVRAVLGYDKGHQIMIDANQVCKLQGWNRTSDSYRYGVFPKRSNT